MSQYNKPFRVKIVGGLAQPGEFRVYEALFVDGLSAGCPDATTLAKMDGAGIAYEKIPWRDEDDVKKITALVLELNESGKKVRELEAQVIELESKLDAAKAGKKAK
jgi:hypothetical protein